MDIETIKANYDNVKTYQNVKSTLKRVNEILGYTPVTVIHEDKYVQHFTEMIRKLLDAQFANGKTALLSKLFLIAGAINRFGRSRNELSSKLMELKMDQTQTMPDVPVAPHTAPAWSEMQKRFQAIIDDPNMNNFAKIFAVCYKHGYCLRPGEIYNTTLKQGVPEVAKNYLDLEGKMWYINDHKTSYTVGQRQFPVTQAFVDELKKYIKVKDFLLIYKSNFTMYNVQVLTSVGIDTSLVSSNDVRNAYEEWNWKQSGRTLQEKRFWSETVLGHNETVVKKYYTSHTMEKEIMSPEAGEQPSQKFLEDTTGKVGASGKIRVKITKKPEPKTSEIAIQTEEPIKPKRKYVKRT